VSASARWISPCQNSGSVVSLRHDDLRERVVAGDGSAETITRLLHQWADGDAPAGAHLFAIVYDELRVIAHAQRRRWVGDDTLGTTALVNEVYLRLAGSAGLSVADRAHFFAVAARATRQVLSNYARRRHAERRGRGTQPVSLEQIDTMALPRDGTDDAALDRLWDLESALQQLHTLHPRPCRVVECRYFGGMSVPDTARALGISEATVKRDWLLAQAWLYRTLSHHAASHD
jgi:RNA polymerase sigma factor (TIGR02999 family)